jgi:transposase
LHYAVWQQAGKQVRAVDHLLGDLGRGFRDDVRRLETVPGVGPIVALTAVAVFADVQRFGSAKARRELRRPLPSTYQSGDRDRHGQITKRGSADLRTMLLHCPALKRLAQHCWTRSIDDGKIELLS